MNIVYLLDRLHSNLIPNPYSFMFERTYERTNEVNALRLKPSILDVIKWTRYANCLACQNSRYQYKLDRLFYCNVIHICIVYTGTRTVPYVRVLYCVCVNYYTIKRHNSGDWICVSFSDLHLDKMHREHFCRMAVVTIVTFSVCLFSHLFLSKLFNELEWNINAYMWWMPFDDNKWIPVKR